MTLEEKRIKLINKAQALREKRDAMLAETNKLTIEMRATQDEVYEVEEEIRISELKNPFKCPHCDKMQEEMSQEQKELYGIYDMCQKCFDETYEECDCECLAHVNEIHYCHYCGAKQCDACSGDCGCEDVIECEKCGTHVEQHAVEHCFDCGIDYCDDCECDCE